MDVVGVYVMCSVWMNIETNGKSEWGKKAAGVK